MNSAFILDLTQEIIIFTCGNMRIGKGPICIILFIVIVIVIGTNLINRLSRDTQSSSSSRL